MKAELAATGGDPFTTYTITSVDAAGPFVASIPTDYSEKAKLEHMSFASVTEMLGRALPYGRGLSEGAQSGRGFLPAGNDRARSQCRRAGDRRKVARITADKKTEQVLAYDAYDKLSWPIRRRSVRPTRRPQQGRMPFRESPSIPNYTYNPKVNFKQGENDKVLTIPPGPNGPVGSIWIALDKPTYGIHGTPDPSKIGKTESHGCIRLTNWDAGELAKLVSAGTTVDFME